MGHNFEFPERREIADIGIVVTITSRGRQHITAASGTLGRKGEQPIAGNILPNAFKQRIEIAGIGKHVACDHQIKSIMVHIRAVQCPIQIFGHISRMKLVVQLLFPGNGDHVGRQIHPGPTRNQPLKCLSRQSRAASEIQPRLERKRFAVGKIFKKLANGDGGIVSKLIQDIGIIYFGMGVK